MPHALYFLVLALAGWVNRHQENLIDYLREENRVLREHLGPRPLRLTDAQRRRLAVRGQKLGHNIARNTVKRILHDHGLDPAPERNQRTPWKTFLQTHGEGLAAADSFTVEVLTLAGLRRS